MSFPPQLPRQPRLEGVADELGTTLATATIMDAESEALITKTVPLTGKQTSVTDRAKYYLGVLSTSECYLPNEVRYPEKQIPCHQNVDLAEPPATPSSTPEPT